LFKSSAQTSLIDKREKEYHNLMHQQLQHGTDLPLSIIDNTKVEELIHLFQYNFIKTQYFFIKIK